MTEPSPDSSFYPLTCPCGSSAYRQFQPVWLKLHPWLHYSKHAFCRACVFFAPERVGGQIPGNFVTKPFKEVFVDFVVVERITGEVLTKAILQWLATQELPASDFGVSAMMAHPICQG